MFFSALYFKLLGRGFDSIQIFGFNLVWVQQIMESGEGNIFRKKQGKLNWREREAVIGKEKRKGKEDERRRRGYYCSNLDKSAGCKFEFFSKSSGW